MILQSFDRLSPSTLLRVVSDRRESNPRLAFGSLRIMVSVLRLTFVRSGLCRAESRHGVEP